MKGKWIAAGVLIVALSGIGLLIVYAIVTGVSLAGRSGLNLEIKGSSAFSAEADVEKQFSVGTAPSLVVDNNSSGEITIRGGSAGQLLVTAHKTAFGSSRKGAEAELGALEVQITQEGGTVTVRVPPQPTVICIGFCRADRVDFTITVPQGTRVEARTDSGNVSVSGTGGEAVLFSAYGDLRATGISGAVTADTRSGSVGVEDARGGDVNLHSDYGDVSLSQVAAGQVTVGTQSGVIHMTDVTASDNMSLKDGYGSVSFTSGEAADLEVEAGSGTITLQDLILSTVIAHSNYGEVRLSGVSAGSYDLSSTSGAVTVDGVSGRLKVRDSYGNILVRNANQVVLDLDTSSGKVEFQGTLGAGPHALHSNYGSILLAIPADTPLSFDLKTNYGKISSAIPFDITGEVNEEHWTGTLNSGGAILTASTGSGNILIDILNP